MSRFLKSQHSVTQKENKVSKIVIKYLVLYYGSHSTLAQKKLGKNPQSRLAVIKQSLVNIPKITTTTGWWQPPNIKK